jgi:glycosyltransferase involved in cell wall biosynthesis
MPDIRICVVTSQPAATEPRARRHAIAASEAFPEAEVTLVDVAPAGTPLVDPPELAAARVERRTLVHPTRQSNVVSLAYRKLQVATARGWHLVTGTVTEPVFGDWAIGLTEQLRQLQADLYIAHQLDTWSPAALAASQFGAKLVVDCMEYYSDMGDGQTAFLTDASKTLERNILPRCALVLASSDALADALAKEFEIPRPLALYNTPKTRRLLPRKEADTFDLYWRNTVIGFGQRGLDDALAAVARLPEEIRLNLQGRMPSDGGIRLRRRIAELGIAGRVNLLPSYSGDVAVEQAAFHTIGLCLERRGPVNHDYTVSNKLFDYMMAGLPVIAPNLCGQRFIIERSGGGLLFEPGSVDSLREQILRLCMDRTLLRTLSENARAFALREGNLDVDMRRLKTALLGALGRHEEIPDERAILLG